MKKAQPSPKSRYPQPRDAGGRLIRQAIALLRGTGASMPIDSHIHIAVSGGLDSTALLQLLGKYGRRVAGHDRLTVLHFNHRWRGEESDRDARFVESRAKELGIPCVVAKGEPPRAGFKGSWEDHARKLRIAFFEAEARKRGGQVMTAHQADDLAETALWRLLTGTSATHGGGIAVRQGVFLRPLLTSRRADLQLFLKEEGVKWREDSTNQDPRFLRARMRKELMPALEGIFPRGVEHLVKAAVDAQCRDRSAVRDSAEADALGFVFEAAGLSLRSENWKAVQNRLKESASDGEVQLPGGWRLRRARTASGVRWILEKS